jgi:hypothetical protein
MLAGKDWKDFQSCFMKQHGLSSQKNCSVFVLFSAIRRSSTQ